MVDTYDEFRNHIKEMDVKIERLKTIYAEYDSKKNDFRMYVSHLRNHGAADFSTYAIDELYRKWKNIKDYSAIHRSEIDEYCCLINDKSKCVLEQLDSMEYSI